MIRTALALAALAAGTSAAAAEAPICTDRPAKANATCTVPAGKAQVETAAIGWSLTRADGVRTEVVSVGSSFAKIGLGARSDLQVGVTPFVRATVKSGAVRDRVLGIGDLTVRFKHRLTTDADKAQVAVIPFIKLPTAKTGIGNGE